jgi:hypothetical protein
MFKFIIQHNADKKEKERVLISLGCYLIHKRMIDTKEKIDCN